MQEISQNQYLRIILLFISFLFFSYNLLSQDTAIYLMDENELLEYTNDLYGSDDMLINGRIYVPLHSLAEGHPYYQVIDWIRGDIHIKGHTFKEVQLKYDIELDEFILFIKDKKERKNYLVLNRNYIDSVYLGKYLFVNSLVLHQLNKNMGYVEMIYDKNFVFFVKHSKGFKKEFSESKPYGEYAEQKSVNYIFENSVLTKMPSKKSFIEYFPNQKKEIKKYMKRNKIKYKKANSGELFKLLEYCNEIRTI